MADVSVAVYMLCYIEGTEFFDGSDNGGHPYFLVSDPTAKTINELAKTFRPAAEMAYVINTLNTLAENPFPFILRFWASNSLYRWLHASGKPPP
ncbi:MAG: hypothetical protein KKB02_14645, partial [Alphaproteobacteria bacterium]|nr:hypothetical protein [Alphaproteobacteria bacterium]